MKVQNHQRWADQKLELQADERTRQFLDLYTQWLDAAEADWGPTMTRLRAALIKVEKANHVVLSMEHIGQMLLMAVDHWVYGPEVDEGLTSIERRTMEQMAAIQLAALGESAKL